MANKTPNYKLTKPLASEFYDVEVQNGNMDSIDAALKSHDDQIANKVDLVDGKIDPSQMPANVVPIVSTSGSGTAYTAMVDGVTALETGMLLVIVPHVVSTSITPTLNINNLGARTISRRTSATTTAGNTGYSSNWIAASKPLLVQYDGSYWAAIGQAKPNAADLTGTTPVNRGGTGKVSWANYRLIYPSSSTALAQLSFPTTAGSFLRQGTSGAPYWSAPTETLEAIGAVPTTRTINGEALSSDIMLTAADVGAVPTSRTVNDKALTTNISLTASDVGAVPTGRTVNNKALSSDITLTAGDVGAVPTTRTVNGKVLSSNITLTAADVSAVPTTRTVNGKALSNDITLTVSDIGVSNIFLAVYPVGSIYMTTVSTNPGTLFGGTWVAWGSGRVPVGVNTSDTDFNTVNKTGGSKTHTLTVAELPLHDHTLFLYWGTGSSAGSVALTQGLDNDFPKMYQGESNRPHTTVTGNGQAHNNLQPYITCYMWRRTA